MVEQKKQTFIAEQAQRIDHIKDMWRQLGESDWDEKQLEKLYAELRTFASDCALHDLTELNDAVFSIEVYLSSFIGLNTTPNKKQYTEIDNLIQALNINIEDDIEISTENANNYIYVLDLKSNFDQKIMSDLKESGFHIDLFTDIEALNRAFDVLQPNSVIVESDSSDHITSIKHMTQAPLILVNGNDDIKNRLSLMKSGLALYLTETNDLQQISNRLLDFLQDSNSSNYRVLIVEDDETQAKFASTILEKANIDTRIVTSPFDVLDIMEAFQPDLLLMDIYMPEANGIELTSIIRDHNDFVAIPIIFLSGEHDPDIQLNALSVGGDDFLTKPIKPKHLVKVVTLRIKRARRLANTIGTNTKQDASTGLFSKKHFYDRVLFAIDNRKANQQLVILCIRPDNAEEISDDKLSPLFSQLGSLLNAQLNSQDVTAQIDAQNMVVFIKRDASIDIVELANQLKHSVHGANLDTGIENHKFSISIGVHFIAKDLVNPSIAVNLAKRAVDQAISDGGNLIVVSNKLVKTKETKVIPTLTVEEEIQQALDKQSFQIQFQPILDLSGTQTENYEIILSLKTHNNDILSARNIREHALKMSIQSDIDRWLISTALDILNKRKEDGITSNIFIPQSISSIMDDNYPEWIKNQLREKQIVGTGIILEFRLSDASKDLKGARVNFDVLRELGIEICLSRFSDKEAAFKVLRYLHAKYTKISKHLLHAEHEVITKVIKEIHDAKAKLIVSNMDDPRSIDLHWSAGADLLQGQFIQRPMDTMDYDFSQVVL